MITAIATLAFVLVASRAFKLVHGLKAVDFLPGLRIPFEQFSSIAAMLPSTSWNPGASFPWTWRKTRNIYDRYGCDTVSIVPFISGLPTIFTRSMEVGKQVVVAGHMSGAFGKSVYLGRAFLFWGPSVTVSEGELWRKYRKIAGPAFNNEMYASVWDATRKLYVEMTSVQEWTTRDVIEVPDFRVFTFKFMLSIFASISFDLPLTWTSPSSHHGEMNLHECLEIVKETYTFVDVAPAWAWKLPFPWVRRIRCAYDTMRAFMHIQIGTTRETVQSGPKDAATNRGGGLFARLIRASEEAGSKMTLSDSELIGNVFAFIIAGHDTTAHTLAATLAFLALNSDLQDELVAQVQEVVQGRDDDTLLIEDYGKLDKVLAAFYEGVRMFPSGANLVREAKHDTVLDISDSDEPRILSVKKGTQIVVDLIGVQYNPRYFSEPDEFRPSRWYRGQRDSDQKDESEDYTAFSIGPRACLGRKFASTEGVCFLASLLRDWRVEPLLVVQSNRRVETADEWRERVIQGTIGLTLGIKDVPLRLMRRT